MTATHKLIGRFVLKTPGQTETGLTADDVMAWLRETDDREYEILRIHRVDEEGRMELVGVTAEAFKKRDCFLFLSSAAPAARADYDDIIEWARECPPPCRIELEFGHMREPIPRHSLLMVFPAACGEPVSQWLLRGNLNPGEHASGAASVLAGYESADRQIILNCTLEPES